ncbi:hypothetical protein BDB00DRAFT_873950 [Zychaea mexicana]|uniref:uncharacterized protein n=1 Tax=Zychaea mexicana TaxID=64656 RepID=UPI0022FEC85E|nr:uncharacterized protein BDB00DRAFT_873950 [Zychaea mexicana]KAI9491926.1 hypothetical protein BDB00DRAFT_873950 [Zychaea mexicana]
MTKTAPPKLVKVVGNHQRTNREICSGPGLYRERATKSDETDGDRPLLKDEQKFEFISDKANEVSVDGEKDVRPIGNKKAKALKRRHAEDDDLESLAGEQVKLARLEVVEEGKILLKMVLREEATGDR